MSPEEWNKITSKEKLEIAKLWQRIICLETKMKNEITKEVLQDNIKEALKKKKADMSKLK
jgi:DNA-binding sugar fermentation-stimulating protein